MRLNLASRWLVFIGVILCFTPVFPIGICLVAWYIIDLLFRNGGVNVSQKTYNDNTFNINNLHVNSYSGDDENDFDTPMDHISKESREEMR